MSVIRVQHTEKYVVIKKDAIEDPRLSFKAKGVWTYCMSRPNDWSFHVSHLATVSQDGEKAIYSAINELIEFGYCERIQQKSVFNPSSDHKGFGAVEYIIYEESQIKNNFAHRPFADAQKDVLLSTDKKLSNEKKKLPLPPPQQYEVFKTQKGEEEMSKETIRKKMPSVKNEEFEHAWKEYQKAPIGSVKSVRQWLMSVIQRHRYETQSFAKRDNEKKSHRLQSMLQEGRNPGKVVACSKHVEFIHGSFVKIVKYDVSQEEWEEKTGWIEHDYSQTQNKI